MELTSVEITALVLVVFLGAVVAGLLLYLIRRLRRRRDKLLTDLKSPPELAQDRAFNRIAMARRESEMLARTGADVGSARSLIAQAQGTFDTRNFDRAYEFAQSAHEALVVARRTGVGPGTARSPAAPSATAASPAPPSRPNDPAIPPIPKNRAESQFQLRLLDQELVTAHERRPRQNATIAADSMRSQARAAFDRGDFTDAFRLSLKGRRQLGGTVEALAPSATTRTMDGATATDLLMSGGDAGVTADRLTGADRCPDCGYPALPNDQYCRGCGRPRAPSVCPVCNAPRVSADTFCGRCGARFS